MIKIEKIGYKQNNPKAKSDYIRDVKITEIIRERYRIEKNREIKVGIRERIKQLLNLDFPHEEILKIIKDEYNLR